MTKWLQCHQRHYDVIVGIEAIVVVVVVLVVVGGWVRMRVHAMRWCIALHPFAVTSQTQCMENLSFVTGDVEQVAPPKGSFFLSVHGCNEVSPAVLDMARACEGSFTVVPWCAPVAHARKRTHTHAHTHALTHSR